MAKQTFTTGQVLTAAQMTSLQQTAMGGGSTTAKTASYVLVAADAGTVVQMNSASATTITVNTALFAAGDTVEIQNVGAGVCTVTAGTATVNTSSTLALKQYDAGTLYFNTTSAAIFFASDAADGGSPLTTKGDLYTYSTADARLAVGANNTFLIADSNAATGLKYGGTWTTWTPTYNNLTVGNGTTTARYQQVGNTVFYFIKFVMGTTSVVSGDVYYSLPVGSASNALYNGVAEYIDTGTQDFGGTVEYSGSNGFFRITNVAGTYATYSTTLSATRPFTWGSTDIMSAYGWYEVA